MSEHSGGKPLTIGACMTAGEHSIGASQTLELAALRMAQLRVGDLPVLEAGKPVGMLSERDIAVIRSVLPGQAARIPVEDAMSGVPYCVTPDTSVAEAARHMAVRKLGSALVLEHGRAIGVFTTADALALLAELLEAGAGETGTEAPAAAAQAQARHSTLIGPVRARRGVAARRQVRR